MTDIQTAVEITQFKPVEITAPLIACVDKKLTQKGLELERSNQGIKAKFTDSGALLLKDGFSVIAQRVKVNKDPTELVDDWFFDDAGHFGDIHFKANLWSENSVRYPKGVFGLIGKAISEGIESTIGEEIERTATEEVDRNIQEQRASLTTAKQKLKELIVQAAQKKETAQNEVNGKQRERDEIAVQVDQGEEEIQSQLNAIKKIIGKDVVDHKEKMGVLVERSLVKPTKKKMLGLASPDEDPNVNLQHDAALGDTLSLSDLPSGFQKDEVINALKSSTHSIVDKIPENNLQEAALIITTHLAQTTGKQDFDFTKFAEGITSMKDIDKKNTAWKNVLERTVISYILTNWDNIPEIKNDSQVGKDLSKLLDEGFSGAFAEEVDNQYSQKHSDFTLKRADRKQADSDFSGLNAILTAAQIEETSYQNLSQACETRLRELDSLRIIELSRVQNELMKQVLGGGKYNSSSESPLVQSAVEALANELKGIKYDEYAGKIADQIVEAIGPDGDKEEVKKLVERWLKNINRVINGGGVPNDTGRTFEVNDPNFDRSTKVVKSILGGDSVLRSYDRSKMGVLATYYDSSEASQTALGGVVEFCDYILSGREKISGVVYRPDIFHGVSNNDSDKYPGGGYMLPVTLTIEKKGDGYQIQYEDVGGQRLGFFTINKRGEKYTIRGEEGKAEVWDLLAATKLTAGGIGNGRSPEGKKTMLTGIFLEKKTQV